MGSKRLKIIDLFDNLLNEYQKGYREDIPAFQQECHERRCQFYKAVIYLLSEELKYSRKHRIRQKLRESREF
jgi:hypothetical protein